MKRRLFFALWPGDEVRRLIADTARRLASHHPGNPVIPANLHLTLAFLGNVDANQYQCVEAMASALRCTGFTLTLDQFGMFPRARVAWLGPQHTPQALQQLSDSVSRAARECGIHLDDRPFNPHVTLARKTSRLQETAIEPIAWQVDAFCLVQSNTLPEGVRYEVIGRWPLLTS